MEKKARKSGEGGLGHLLCCVHGTARAGPLYECPNQHQCLLPHEVGAVEEHVPGVQKKRKGSSSMATVPRRSHLA